MQPRITLRGWSGQRAVALMLLLLAGLAGCAQRPAQFPPGTYTTTIAAADVSNEAQKGQIGGDWAITFRADGTFSVIRHDVEVDFGTYTVAGDQISMADKGGTYLPSGDAARSIYRWAVQPGGSLTFAAVEDVHPDRPTIMQSHPWAKAE